MAIDARNLYPTPGEMSYEQGALLEPLSVGHLGLQAGESGGRVTTFWSAGPDRSGLLAAAVARAFGAGSVTVTDLSEFRLGMAQRMGFATERSDAPSDKTFDVLLECSGAPGALGCRDGPAWPPRGAPR